MKSKLFKLLTASIISTSINYAVHKNDISWADNKINNTPVSLYQTDEGYRVVVSNQFFKLQDYKRSSQYALKGNNKVFNPVLLIPGSFLISRPQRPIKEETFDKYFV